MVVLAPLLFLGWMLPCWEQVFILDGGRAARPELFVGLGEDRVRRDGRRRCATVGVGEVNVGGVTGFDGGPGRVVAEAATVGVGDFGRYRHRDGFGGGGADVFQSKMGETRTTKM